MQNNWKKMKLGEITEKIIDYRGKTPKKLGGDWASSGYRALSAKNIKNGGIVQINSIRYCDEVIYRKWMKDEIQKGDIFITSEAPFGELLYWDSDEKIVLSQRLFAIRTKSNVCPKFLYYYMSGFDFQSELKNRSTGTTVVGLRQPELLKCTIKLPDLETQKKIASILSALDDKIELNNKISANLEAQAQAIFKSWFVDYEPFGGVRPEGWREGVFEEIALFQNGYAFKSKDLLSKKDNGSYDIFKQGHIKRGGGFKQNGTKNWISSDKLSKKIEKFVLKKGDVLMAMTDMKDNVQILGNTAIMPFDSQFVLNQRVALLRPNINLGFSYPYIYLLTNSFDFLSNLRKTANRGVQVNLSAEAIRKAKVVIPVSEVNFRFSKLIVPFFEQMIKNDSECSYLEQVRDNLLCKLITGGI